MTDLIDKAMALEICESHGAAGEAIADKITALPAQGVRVEPLVWHDSYGVFRAETPFGDFKVAGKILHHLGSSAPQSVHGSTEEAQAAAQADYERRILAALEPASGGVEANPAERSVYDRTGLPPVTVTPAPVATDRVDALVKALRWIEDCAAISNRVNIQTVAHDALAAYRGDAK